MDDALSIFIARLPEPALLVDLHGVITVANPAACRALHKSFNDFHHLNEITSLSHEQIIKQLKLCSRSTKPLPLGLFADHTGSEPNEFRATGFLFQPATQTNPALILVRLSTGDTSGSRFVTLNTELDRQKKMFKRLSKKSEELDRIQHKLNSYIETVDKYVITSSTNQFGRITYTSEAFCKISQYREDELIGRSHNIVRHPDMPTSLYEDLWKTISSGKRWQGEIKNLAKDGSAYWVDVNIEPQFDKYGQITGYTAIRQDITAKKVIEELSRSDHLTGLANRSYTDEVLDHEISRSIRYSKPVSIILFDIDHFKQVNDNFGHLAGDQVLKEIAVLMTERIREIDTAGRWGGEEFIVICPETDAKGASELAEDLRKAMESRQFESVGSITGSFGVASYDINESRISLIKRVDDALYKAKQSGRNLVKLA